MNFVWYASNLCLKMPCKLQVGEAIFSPDSLPEKHAEPFIQRAFDFCREWLSEKDEFIIYTSGSTGKPKAISLSRQQMQASAQLTAQALMLKENDTALVCLSADYIAGRMMLVRGLELGLHLHLVKPSGDPTEGLPKETKIDFAAVVPLQMQQILENENTAFFSGGKAIIIGGAPVSLPLEEKLQTLDCPAWATYGMTETVTHIALRKLNGTDRSPYFKALPQVKLSIDERGYLQITAPTTKYETLTTNDHVNLRSESEFEWLGRADFVINSGGVKVQPEKIETATARWLFTRNLDMRVCALGIPDERLGQRVVLVLETVSLDNKADLESFLRDHLSRYEVPKEIHFIKEFPETKTQKVDRKALETQLSCNKPE
ncbi:MAG: AMP-binding protein, partial [Bacteroidota bacterium]